MEVASGNDLARVGEDQRIVGDGIHLALDDRDHVGDGVAERAVHLRHAADAVGVLHFVAVGVGDHDRAVLQQSPQIGRAGCLAGMGPNLLDARIERPERALGRLHRHGSSDIGDLGEMPGARGSLGQ